MHEPLNIHVDHSLTMTTDGWAERHTVYVELRYQLISSGLLAQLNSSALKVFLALTLQATILTKGEFFYPPARTRLGHGGGCGADCLLPIPTATGAAVRPGSRYYPASVGRANRHPPAGDAPHDAPARRSLWPSLVFNPG